MRQLQYFIFLISAIIYSCSGNKSDFNSRFNIPVSDSYTEDDKQHINHYKYFCELADSLIIYFNANDMRRMGLIVVAMNEEQENAITSWKQTNKQLNQHICRNIDSIHKELDGLNIPHEVTFRIKFENIPLFQFHNGTVVREGYDKYNDFDLYNIRVDSAGYAVRTVRRNREKVDNIPFKYNGSTIKDIVGEYPFKNYETMEIRVIN